MRLLSAHVLIRRFFPLLWPLFPPHETESYLVFFCACCGGISAANLFFFFMCSRSFILSRPSRRKLKQSGILKERVFGCDLGEHLLNSARESESTVVSLKDTRKIPKDAEKMPPYSWRRPYNVRRCSKETLTIPRHFQSSSKSWKIF